MPEPFKDKFFQASFIQKLGQLIKKECSAFDEKKFADLMLTKNWNEKPLKEKMRTVSKALGETLPDFKEAIEILKKIEKEVEGFEHLVFSDFVEVYGLDDFETSMSALEVFTRSTSEFAIRPFIVKYPKETMAQMLIWSKDKESFVRRLSSEGCRPKLPWGLRLKNFVKDPSPILPILENLKDDPSNSVRLSVSNNLNDISKDHPEIVLDIAKKWKGKSKQVDEILKHALRGLLKKGNREALELFGFENADGIMVKNLKIEPTEIKIGESGNLIFEISSKKTKKIRLEYLMSYITSTGKESKKIFQIQEKDFLASEVKIYKRKLDFTDRTIRKHFPGEHKLALIVNGKVVEERKFYLKSE